ncbi:Plasmodium vivax Vir protein, putative [Plasmodium ovale]|uniref:Plasmodium vivax Vir protein, putative n=1 Tax=Plasmodium ovale TaxID=36330 RepID=A0A1C3KHL2_PLAOA|nr:Plasmodium vivax Vir protein, putative [Plasmodium ovale]
MIGVKDYVGHEDRCLHYVYWIYDQIAKKCKSVSDYEYIKDIIKVFKDKKAYITNGFIEFGCQYDFHHDNFDYLKSKVQKKYLHDYFKNHVFINKIINASTNTEYENYRKYITSIKILYEDYKKNECTDYLDSLDSDCPDYFRIEEVYDPQNLLSILEYRKNKNFASDINSQISLNAASKSVMNKNFELGKEVSDVKFNCYKGFYSAEIKENRVKKEKKYYGLFTSLGSMFNRKTKRNKENFNNIFENEEGHLLEHMSERQNVKSPNRRLHVAYHPEGRNVR